MVCPVLLTFHLWDSENDSCSCYQLEIVQHSFHDLTHRSGCSVASSRFQRTSRKVGQEKKKVGKKFNKPLLHAFVINPGHKTSLLYVLKKFKILPNDPETKHKKKNIYYFLYHHSFHSNVRSASKSDNQPGTFTCKCTQCKTCPFISNTVKISGPNLRTQSLHASP